MKNSYLNLEDIPAWELEEYADGKATPRITTFFKNHPAAHEQWQTETQMFSKLKKHLFRFECPTVESLQSYHWHDVATGELGAGELGAEELHSIENHLQTCPSCAEELATLRKFVPIEMSADPNADPSATRPLSALFDKIRDSLSQFQAKIDDARIAVALLVTSNNPQLALGSLRGGDDDLQEDKNPLFSPLIYEHEENTIILTIRPGDEDRKNIQGQVLTLLPQENSWVTLVPANPLFKDSATKADAVGNFEFNNVAEDAYQMIIVLGEQTIVIPNLVLL